MWQQIVSTVLMAKISAEAVILMTLYCIHKITNVYQIGCWLIDENPYRKIPSQTS